MASAPKPKSFLRSFFTKKRPAGGFFDPIKGKTVPVFFYYSIPSVLSMMAISCAVIIDGFFIGRYGGPRALASVNLTVPVSTVLIGIALMLSVGGAARCGRALGRGDIPAAHRIFSQTLMATLLIALITTVLGLIFTPSLVRLLGANEVLFVKTYEYLRIMAFFFICPMGIVCLASFLRVDGRPIYAAGVMISGSLLNVVLDWLLVARLGMGHTGAALGTGLSELVTLVFLILPFALKNARLRFFMITSDWSESIRSAYNGFSEFSNEVSGGLITFLFNWVIIQNLGETGVAAFSVINYLILCGIIIHCGISDSIQPVVSKNFGARKPGRIVRILGLSTVSVVGIGAVISYALIIFPDECIGLFIHTGNRKTTALTLTLISCIWPLFLLNGFNIMTSSYLTAMNRAFDSTVVSLARNLILPGLFLWILPRFAGHHGIFLALPLSEFATFFLALYLLRQNSPAKLIPGPVTGQCC